MTKEEKLQLVKDYINEIERLSMNNRLHADDRLHYKKALNAYNDLYMDALNNKFDVNLLHENITDYLYVFGDGSMKN
jgi:hypothetical protein